MVEPTYDQTHPPRPKPADGWSVFDFSLLLHPPAALAGVLYAVVALAAAAVIAAGFWILLQFVVQAFASAPKDFEDTGRRLLALGLIVAAPFAIWRIVISHWQARAAQTQATAAARQADVAREEHYTSLFTAAVQQLGAMRKVQEDGATRTEPNTEARLGAIYALERVAQDSERDHWPIMETLCAYVRNNAGAAEYLLDSESEAAAEGWPAHLQKPRLKVDVQAALTVIGRRSVHRVEHEKRQRQAAKDRNSYRLDLSHSNLTGAFLTGDFDFANFEYSSLAYARVHGTTLRRASFFHAHAEAAEFSQVEFERTILIGSHCEGATFRDLRCEKFELFHADLRGAHFIGTTFNEAMMYGIKANAVSFSRTTFAATTISSGELIGASFEGCSLDGLKLESSPVAHALNLMGANCANVQGLTQEIIDSSYGDKRTTLPEGVDRPALWTSDDPPPRTVTDYQIKWREARSVAIEAHRQARAERARTLDDDIPF